MIYYFDSEHDETISNMCKQLDKLIQDNYMPGQPIVVMCIGSDRSTGDSLGPLVGYKLSKFSFENIYIYGSLNQPIHATNLSETIDKINKTHLCPFIIALDASLGKKEHIGYITLANGPLKPGIGVKKKLPEVGSLHITGIVNYSGIMDHALLQTTRLSTIMTMADIITAVLVNTFLTDVFPYKQQEPVQLYQQLLSS